MPGRLKIGLILSLLMLCLTAGAEQEGPSSIALESPDYSKEALLKIIQEEDVALEVHEDGVELRWANWILRFLPIVMPLTINDGTHSSAQINQPVSGLALLGVDYPLVGPAGDEFPPHELSWRERRFRRRMIGEVNAANRRDNR